MRAPRSLGSALVIAFFVALTAMSAACDRRGSDYTVPRDEAGPADDTPGGMNTPPADTTTNLRGSTP